MTALLLGNRKRNTRRRLHGGYSLSLMRLAGIQHHEPVAILYVLSRHDAEIWVYLALLTSRRRFEINITRVNLVLAAALGFIHTRVGEFYQFVASFGINPIGSEPDGYGNAPLYVRVGESR